MRMPYGSWPSPITATAAYAGSVELAEPRCDGDTIYWLEGRAAEGGREVLVRRSPDGTVTDLTPAPWSVRSRVHEYGGGAYAVRDGLVVFTELGTGQVVRLDEQGPVPITPDAGDARVRFGGLVIDPSRGVVFAVREDHRRPDREPVNALVRLDLRGPNEDYGTVLDGFGAQGPDFTSAPSLSPDGRHLAWVSWRHPNMPWDSSFLHVGRLDEAGELAAGLHHTPLAGGPSESVEEPTWLDRDRLVLVSDRTGFGNVYLLDVAAQTPTGRALTPIAPAEVEFGLPRWGLGMQTMAVTGEGELVARRVEDGFGRLSRWHGAAGTFRPISTAATEVSAVTAPGPGRPGRAGTVVALCRFADRPPALVRIGVRDGATELVRSSSDVELEPGYVSHPEPVSWRSEEGSTAHGFYYPPANPGVAADAGELPPLIVKTHGGPTAAALPGFDLSVLYWTSRGLGVLDVNYGGSTGYGRAYRERLRGGWGIVDVADACTGAQHLADTGRVDGARMAITGGSAGGYTTLAALTFRDTFAAGASRYGISDLSALAAETHKFESRYCTALVGPWPEAEQIYRDRSPVHHVDQLDCPVILLQGDQDRVVPPNQAALMAEAVRAKGLPVAHLVFEGEGHGFRSLDNQVWAREAEAYFYSRVFGYDLADEITPVPIDNLPG